MSIKRLKEKIFGKGELDLTFFVTLLIIVAFGLVMLFSASFANAHYYKGNSFYYIERQAIFTVVGIVAMLVISKIDYTILKKFAYLIYAVSIVLLALTLVSRPVNGARRWIDLGFTTFQPSELVKFSVILLFSKLIDDDPAKMKTFKYGVLRFVLLLAPILGIMYFEPHLSGMIIILLISAAMMFIGGTKLRWFVLAAGAAPVAAIGILVSGKIEYAMTRINGWIHPFSDTQNDTYQTVQSLIAIGSGGIFGKGLGNSRQKFLFLPEPQNDFIFAIICEELGLIGALGVIVLFIILIVRGLNIAVNSKDRFGSLLAAGLIIQIAVQAALNICVVSNTLPNTGISLPFFSYGGTSIMMLLMQMGVVLSVSRSSRLSKA